ncbi:MAG: cardiolipin synthase [Oscillospiraceae bacterium]
MKKIIRRILSVIPGLLLQILWTFLLIDRLSPYAAAFGYVLTFLAFIYVLYIISSRNESTYKTLWLLVILGLPIIGAVLYLLFGNKKSARPLMRKLKRSEEELQNLLPDKKGVAETIKSENTRIGQTFSFISEKTGFPVLPCESAEYYSVGEKLWQQLLIDLETAKKSIYAEYFIIEDGVMWGSIMEILERKVKEGVDVRVIYDDLGSVSTFSKANAKELISKGIKCVPFNPLVFIKGTVNYRDHRKMFIIDNETVFSGGINLADEYINEKKLFGHWKDIGFRLTGEPVSSYTKMFSEFWNAFSKEQLVPTLPEYNKKEHSDNGYVLSYYDSPLYKEAASNNLYIEILSQATEYVWFYTPYLMLGDSLSEAMMRAAERGVDVRIIMPGIPDKKFIYRMSRSYYPELLKSGVKIYEYTPGFVHAKACISDDKLCTVGTVNLDYRSLFLHFENNALFYNSTILNDLKDDYIKTQSLCRECKQDEKFSPLKWFINGILHIFAPLC